MMGERFAELIKRRLVAMTDIVRTKFKALVPREGKELLFHDCG